MLQHVYLLCTQGCTPEALNIAVQYCTVIGVRYGHGIQTRSPVCVCIDHVFLQLLRQWCTTNHLLIILPSCSTVLFHKLTLVVIAPRVACRFMLLLQALHLGLMGFMKAACRGCHADSSYMRCLLGKCKQCLVKGISNWTQHWICHCVRQLLSELLTRLP